MKLNLYYVTDVYCVWCYGFRKTIDRIASEYADRVELQIVNGCMISQEVSLGEFFGRFPDPLAIHQRVSDTSGEVFGEPYLEHIRAYTTSKRKLNSLAPARAVAAMHKLGVTNKISIYSQILSAYYKDGIDLLSPENYLRLDCMKAVDFKQFESLLTDRATFSAVSRDLAWVNQLGVQGFPALLLEQTDTHYETIARGFMRYEAVQKGLDAALRSLPLATAAGVRCSVDRTCHDWQPPHKHR